MIKEKNKLKITILTILIIAISIGVVIYVLQSNKTIKSTQGIQKQSENIINTTTSTSINDVLVKNEFFSYSLKGVPATVIKEELPFDFTAATLKSNSEDCGTKHVVGYFDKLITKFKDTKKVVYNFTYQETSQDNLVYKITIVPNKPNYTSLDQFTKDFDQCFIAGDAYPLALNKDWLLFVSSCGAGFEDGSGRPDGCGILSSTVTPTLKLNY